MKKINREDMLELTRRMTPSRNCFSRIAGAYYDEEGFVDGTFNVHFLKLKPAEIAEKLKIAKEIPFSETNSQLTAHSFPSGSGQSKQMWQMLRALTGEGLKNDAVLDVLYELAGDIIPEGRTLGLFLFYGSYDVPCKSTGQEYQYESEEVYSFLIGSLCPVDQDYTPGSPEWGFLFPAFAGRSTDWQTINIFESEPDHPHKQLMQRLLGIEFD